MEYKGYYVNVVLLDNACGIKGSVIHNKDDSYTVFIDANLSYEEQQEVCRHEMRHILNCDFEKCNVNNIEFNAHELCFR